MAERHGQYKKASDVEAGRRARHDTTVAIRKAKKHEQTAARRKMDTSASAMSVGAEGQHAYANGGSGAGAGAGGGAYASSTRTEGLSEMMQKRLAQLPQHVDGLYSTDRTRVSQSCEAIRKLLSIERKPPIEEVIQTGVVPRLVELISQDDSHELQFEAAWALTNIASGTTHHTKVVIDAGAVPIFVRLLNSPNADVREQAIWALGNISGDAVKYRNMVLEQGAMPLLLQQIIAPGNKLSVLRNGTWTLSNFCRGKPPPPLDVIRPALQVLTWLINLPDDDVITDACWALSYISDGSHDRIDAVIGSGVCARLVELLNHHTEVVQTPALRAVGNIVTGNDLQTQAIINIGALKSLVHLLGSPKSNLVKETCWTLSNITAGSAAQVQAVIDAGIFPPLIVHLYSNEFDVRKEAAWAVSNATSGGEPAQIRYIAQQGAIRPFVKLLEQADQSLIMLALECLENILKVGQIDMQAAGLEVNPYVRAINEVDGISAIEALQEHRDLEVHQKAVAIIENYFGTVDEVAFVHGAHETFNNAGFRVEGVPPPGGAPPAPGAPLQQPGGFAFAFRE